MFVTCPMSACLLLSCSNKVAQLTSENKALKTQKKKLIEGVQRVKASEADVGIKGDSTRRLPEGKSVI